MTFAKRSAKVRGRAFGLAGFSFLPALLRGLTRLTSTSVPSAKARGLSSTTLPFLTLPRIVMFNLLVPALFYPPLPFSSNASTAFSPPQSLLAQPTLLSSSIGFLVSRALGADAVQEGAGRLVGAAFAAGQLGFGRHQLAAKRLGQDRLCQPLGPRR